MNHIVSTNQLLQYVHIFAVEKVWEVPIVVFHITNNRSYKRGHFLKRKFHTGAQCAHAMYCGTTLDRYLQDRLYGTSTMGSTSYLTKPRPSLRSYINGDKENVHSKNKKSKIRWQSRIDHHRTYPFRYYGTFTNDLTFNNWMRNTLIFIIHIWYWITSKFKIRLIKIIDKYRNNFTKPFHCVLYFHWCLLYMMYMNPFSNL